MSQSVEKGVGGSGGMVSDHFRISLHILIQASSRPLADQLDPILRTRFPESLITLETATAEVQSQLKNTVFDLIVLALQPLRKNHADLLRTIRDHPQSMPTIILVAPADEAELHRMLPDLPSCWEIVPVAEPISGETLGGRVRMAIENHQRQWELRHLQQAFRSSIKQHRNIIDEVPDLIFICDRTGCLLEINATSERMLGVGKDRLLMRPITESFGMRESDFNELVDRATRGEGSSIEDVEIELRPAGAAPIYALAHLICRDSALGNTMQFQGVIKDISPHKHLEQQLRQSEDKYRTLYELSRITSSSLRLEEVVDRSLELVHRFFDAKSSMLLLNRSYEELNLIAAVNVEPAIAGKLRHRPGAPLIGQDPIGRLAITAGMTCVSSPDEMNLLIADWMRAHAPCTLVAMSLGRGNPILPAAILLMLMPPERAAEVDQELLASLSKTLEMGMTNCFHYANSQEAETRYRALWDHAPAYFISLLKGGVIFEVNRTAATALGYGMQELIGHPLTAIIDPHDHFQFEQRHKLLMDTGESQTYELRLLSSRGERIIVSVKSEPLVDRNGHPIGEKSILHDITRDKEMEERLRDYAENLEQMVEDRTLELTKTMSFLNGILEGSTEYAILGLDSQGLLLHFNRGAQLMFGYEPEALVGRASLETLIDFDHAVWPDLAELFESVNRAGVLVHETPVRTATGGDLIALLTINRLRQSTGGLHYVAILRDITEQKELEELLKLYTENLQQVIQQKTRELDLKHVQLIQSSKLATLGEMATGIAHELNQPLSGISTRAQLIGKSIELGRVSMDQIRQNQTEIVDLVDRITRIINHMRTFARQDQQLHVPFHLAQSIDGAMSLIGEQLRIHAIEVEQSFPPDLPMVYGESLQIEQVILNLISNARDAVDARAEEERLLHGDNSTYRKKINISMCSAAQEEVCLTVEDNGMGIPPDVQDRLFEPFFTTKPVGRGTGLGLSISYGILSSHRGRIEVRSTPGEGSTFSLFLPIACILPDEVHKPEPLDEGEELIL